MANWEKLIEENYKKKSKIDTNTIYELIEQVLLEEGYQDSDIIKKHSSMRLSTKGKKKAGGDPFEQDPPKERSKSAPAGFGALEEVRGVAHPDTMGSVVTDKSGNKLKLIDFEKYDKIEIKNLFDNDSSLTRAIHDYLKDKSNGKEYKIAYNNKPEITQEEEKKLQSAVVVVGEDDSGDIHAFIKYGGGGTWAKGKFKEETGYGLGLSNPNRGELSEAFIAAAIVLRLLHLPETAKIDATGAVIEPAKGLVTSQDVIDFFINGYKGKKIKEVDNNRIEFESSISPGKRNGKTPVDTIRMKVELREPSMRGLLKMDDPNSFVRTDSLVQKYLEAATNYANREIVKWAVGVAQDASGESDPNKAMGFFINDFDNKINVEAVGTEAQSLTKVDLQITCSGDGCPVTGVSIDGAGDLKSEIKQLARLSLKAGTIKHFGGGAATSPQKALDVLKGVFPVNPNTDSGFIKILDDWEKQQTDEEWGFKTVVSKNKKGETKVKKVFDKEAENVDDIAKHRASELRRLIKLYFKHIEEKLKVQGEDSDPVFLGQMIDGLIDNSVKGKKSPKKGGPDYSAETGVILVQSTDAGDFYKIDFKKLNDALGTGADFSATQIGKENPYLAVWSSRIKNDQGEVVDVSEPKSIDDPRVLFTMRMLGRHPSKGGEILRLEKGPLMKKIAGLDQGEKLVYRNGKLVSV